jgi:hypothetical protein
LGKDREEGVSTPLVVTRCVLKCILDVKSNTCIGCNRHINELNKTIIDNEGIWHYPKNKKAPTNFI